MITSLTLFSAQNLLPQTTRISRYGRPVEANFESKNSSQILRSFYRTFAISEEVWEAIEAHLPGRKGTWGGIGKNNRRFINAVFKGWRGIATRYAKKTSSYLAAVQIRCIFLWANIS